MKLLTVLVVCIATAAAQDKPQDKNQYAAPQLGSIAGTVTAGGGGPPMKDVEVYVRRNTPQEQLAVTDQQGRYSIRDVAPGQIRISANAPDASGRTGFGPYASRQVTLAPGQELAGVDFRRGGFVRRRQIFPRARFERTAREMREIPFAGGRFDNFAMTGFLQRERRVIA